MRVPYDGHSTEHHDADAISARRGRPVLVYPQPGSDDTPQISFPREAITGEAKPMRHVVVSLDADGRLVRRFLVETAGDA